MTIVMGIDGGGSTVRVVIVTPDLAIRGQSQGPTVNPNLVGKEAAAREIHAAAHAALDDAGLSADQLTAVGIAVAGASITHSAAWLRDVMAPLVDGSRLVLSSDYEIALVGAMGERRGVLVLSGTGSLAYGVNAAGKSTLVGGWGYLLGDEGSGYWIGLEGLRFVLRADDGSGPPTALTAVLLDALTLSTARALIPWLYHATTPRTHDIAALAPLVIQQAQAGDMAAGQIVQRAARHLAALAQTAGTRLGLTAPSFAFAGGVLASTNPVSEALCHELGLPAMPVPRYPPVIGAALLALIGLGKG